MSALPGQESPGKVALMETMAQYSHVNAGKVSCVNGVAGFGSQKKKAKELQTSREWVIQRAAQEEEEQSNIDGGEMTQIRLRIFFVGRKSPWVISLHLTFLLGQEIYGKPKDRFYWRVWGKKGLKFGFLCR